MRERSTGILTICRLRRLVVAVAVAMVVAAGTTATVGAQWPMACVELNDIVERHLGNSGKVGIYQRTFGEQAEDACQSDHLADVRGAFAWAFETSPTPASTDDGAAADIGGWPTTCVELNDIVEKHRGNDHNVAIYQSVFGEHAETACQLDHRLDVRATFAWARACGIAIPASTSRPAISISTEGHFPTVDEIARESSTLQRYLAALPWLGCHVYPWLADGISQDDIDSLSNLQITAGVNDDLAIFIASTTWFTNGIDYSDELRNEKYASKWLRTIHQTSPAILNIALTYPWLVDDITARELSALKDINELATHDPSLALRVARAPWVMDDIQIHEFDALGTLKVLYDRLPELARQLLGYATEDSVWASDVRIIEIMSKPFTTAPEEARRKYEQRFNRIASQPWFADGLDAEERAFINALDMVSLADDELFELLLSKRYTQSATISLPLAGPFRLWAFQAEPFPEGENVLGRIAAGLLGFEQIMQAALPANDVVVLLSETYRGSANFDGRMRLPRHPQFPLTTDLILETIGEFYFRFSIGPRYPDDINYQLRPPWMKDGGLEFAKAFVNDWLGIREISVQHHVWSSTAQIECASKGLSNIHSVTIQRYPDKPAEARALEKCASLYGSMLLFRLNETIGENAVSSVFRDLYIPTIHDDPKRNDEGNLMPSDMDILRTFLKHTPPHLHDEVRHWYRQIHGAPFIDELR